MLTLPGSRMASSRTSLRGGVVQAQHGPELEALARSSRSRWPASHVPGTPVAWRRRGRTIPDKPTLDGIEARWSERWEADGTYRFDRTAARGRRLLDRHAAADRVRLDPHGHGVRLHPDRRHRPLPADARQVGVLPDRLGRQRPGHRAPGAELLRRALRPDRSRTTPTSSRPFRGDAPKGHHEIPISPAQLRRAVPRAHGHRRGGVRGRSSAASGCPSTGRCSTRRSTTSAGARASSPSSATSPAARRTAPRRRRCGTSTTAPPSPRPRSRTASGPAPTTCSRSTGPGRRRADRHDPARAASSAASPSSPTPTTSATAALVGTTVRTPLFDVEVPVVAHPLAQPDKGTGIAMVCTFGDTTDVTWWRELDLPTRSVIGRDGRFVAGDADVADHRRRRARAYAELAGLTVKQAQAAMVELLRRVGRPARRAAPDHPPGQVLRARQPPARDRHEPPVVHPQRRPRRGPARGVPRPRQGARLVPGPHAPPLRALGRGPQRRLADQPAAVLRRADPAVVSASTPTATLDHDHPIVPAEDTLPIDPSTDVPPGLHAPTSAASPAASSATPTSWTPGRRRR